MAADTGLGSFVELISAPKDGFLIAGEEGVARARFDGGTLQWEEIRLDRQHRLHHVSALSQALGGDLFATARDERTQGDVLLRRRGGTWTILARAASPAERLRGWSGVSLRGAGDGSERERRSRAGRVRVRLLPWYRAPGFLATAGIATLVIAVLGALHVSRYQQLGGSSPAAPASSKRPTG